VAAATNICVRRIGANLGPANDSQPGFKGADATPSGTKRRLKKVAVSLPSAEVPPNAPLITAAICTYQRYDLLEQAIASIKGQTLSPAKFEILVIDNSPDAEVSQTQSAKYSDIERFRWIYEHTPGLSNARNVAASNATAPLIAFLDDDAVADSVWLESLLKAYDIFGASVHCIGGPVRPRWGGDRPHWLCDELLAYLSVVNLGGEPRLLENGEWLAGANVSYRTDSIKKVGGFSMSLGRTGSAASLMSNEEIELADRLKKVGGYLAYEPLAAVEHHIAAERLTQEWFRRRAAWQAVSDYVRSPKEMRAATAQHWDALKMFLASCPPLNRTMRGLVLPETSCDRFRWQLSAIYNAVISLLSGMNEPDDD
jgi:GT2 family glycosyltransferase